jgi:Putative polyhydroxyalkanoic acid system protein (PHA_gran_rgn)
MKHSVNHDLGRQRAREVAQKALAEYAVKFSKYNPRANWVSPDRAEISFAVKGMTLSGTLEVTDHSIDMELEVPFLLRPLRGQALRVIEGEIREWIDKAKAAPE